MRTHLWLPCTKMPNSKVSTKNSMRSSQSWARLQRTWRPTWTAIRVSLKEFLLKRIFFGQMKKQKAPKPHRCWRRYATRSASSKSMHTVCRSRSIRASSSHWSSSRTVPRPPLRHPLFKQSWPWPSQTTTANVFPPPSSAGNNVPHLTRPCLAALIRRAPKTWPSARTWSAC